MNHGKFYLYRSLTPKMTTMTSHAGNSLISTDASTSTKALINIYFLLKKYPVMKTNFFTYCFLQKTSHWSSLSTLTTAPSPPDAPDVPVVSFKTPTHLHLDWTVSL